MMGLAGAITPAGSGKIMIVITGDTDNDTAADGTKMGIRYGTGTAPTNGVALTGTAVGTLPNSANANLALDVNRYPFAVSAVVTGLVVGTPYWVDLSLAAVTGGVARVRNISISIQEIGSGASGTVGATGATGATGPGSGGTTSQVTGSNFTTATGSLDAITGLTFAAASGKVYEVDVLLKVQQSTTGGIKFAISYSGTATGQFTSMASAAVAGVAQTYETNAIGTQTSTTKCTDANSDYTVAMKSIVTTSTTGNITVSMVRLVGGTATCYIGSRMTVTLLA
jgi:hypothetical protein